jgi:hypothetical protein
MGGGWPPTHVPCELAEGPLGRVRLTPRMAWKMPGRYQAVSLLTRGMNGGSSCRIKTNGGQVYWSKICLTSSARDDTHLGYITRLWLFRYMGYAYGKRV